MVSKMAMEKKDVELHNHIRPGHMHVCDHVPLHVWQVYVHSVHVFVVLSCKSQYRNSVYASRNMSTILLLASYDTL